MEQAPSKRPNSLTVLQIARKQLAATEQIKETSQFLPEKPVDMDYVHQAVLELLERLFHSFKNVKIDLKKHLIDKLRTLLDDGRLRSADCWGLDKCLSLQLVLGKEEEAKLLIEERQASWDYPWNTYGLMPEDIAAHNGLLIFRTGSVVLHSANSIIRNKDGIV